MLLQPGKYTVTCTRGPEYLVLKKEIIVPPASTHTETFELKRWAHPAAKGWWSGDHHVHAAGCAHYESPTEGVAPEGAARYRRFFHFAFTCPFKDQCFVRIERDQNIVTLLELSAQ